MDSILPPLITFAFGLIGGYLLGYWNYGLTVKREANNRRRAFRGTIRTIATQAEAANFVNRYKIYQASLPSMKEACARIYDDIRFCRRKGFVRFRDMYCSFKESDIVPPRPQHGANSDELAAYKKKCDEAKTKLADTLEKLAGCAK